MGWQHGNINEQNSTYFEGEVIPYYTTFSNIIPGNEYKIQIEWDTTKAGLHALDYITTYDTSYVPTPPCDDAGITCNTTDTIGIPVDTFMTGQWLPGATQIPGVFTAWNADLLLSSGYTNPANYVGDTSTSIWVTFTARAERVVLAWGGHIGARIDWGMQNSAVFISGSPYRHAHSGILECIANRHEIECWQYRSLSICISGNLPRSCDGDQGRRSRGHNSVPVHW